MTVRYLLSHDDKYSYTVKKMRSAYVPGNESQESSLFSEVGSTFLLNYLRSNGPYEIALRITTVITSPNIDTDLKYRGFGHNTSPITKTIILAFAANKLY